MQKKNDTNEGQEEYKELDEKYGQYSSNYSDENFNQKIESNDLKLGEKLKRNCKFLYYLVTDKDSPIDKTLKGIIYGALGYFILPVDLIPDFLPMGFTDDLAAILAVVGAVTRFAQKLKDDPEKLKALNDLREKAGLDPITLNL